MSIMYINILLYDFNYRTFLREVQDYRNWQAINKTLFNIDCVIVKSISKTVIFCNLFSPNVIFIPHLTLQFISSNIVQVYMVCLSVFVVFSVFLVCVEANEATIYYPKVSGVIGKILNLKLVCVEANKAPIYYCIW